MKRYPFIAVLVLTLCCAQGKADWYEATGQAVIEQGDIDSARQAAIEDALKRAALFAGASLQSTQQLINGILQQEQLGVVSNAQVSKLQLLSENRNNNILTITLRADITPQITSCSGNPYRKPVLLSRIQLQARTDAIYGDLFTLGEHSTIQLERHLRDYSPTAMVSSLPQEMPLQYLVYPATEQLFSQGYQYVISASINDMSLGTKTSHFWQKDLKERHFAINVTLFDLFEQNIVYQQEYRTSANWPYKSHGTPASHSQAFWQMPYGSKIDKLLQIIAADMQQQLQCKPLLSAIKQVRQNEVMLDLGKLHGLQVGDQLQLFHIQRHPTTPGVKRLLQSQLNLTITELTERNAWAGTNKQQLLQHIQPGDVVSVRKNSGY
jgi:hypothetical protein